jgi:hypothetical protein
MTAGVLMVSLIILASMDLWNQFTEYSKTMWYKDYRDAVLAGDDFWQMAYRTENLELKIEGQESRMHKVRQNLNNLLPRMKIDMENLRGNLHDFKHTRAARISMHDLLINDTEIYRITCGNDAAAPLLRVGLNDFRTDERDSCDVFTDWNVAPDMPTKNTGKSKIRYNPERILPNAFFEKVPLDEGAFALRPLSTGGNYLQVIPPENALSYDRGPWKVVVGGSVVGQQERFRITDEGYIYSPAVGGYLQCSGNQQVRAEPSLSKYSASRFVLQKIGEKDVRYAEEVVSLSEQILSIQQAYTLEHQVSIQAQNAAIKSVTSSDNPAPVRICVGIPMTSKGTEMSSVRDSPLWSNLFDSFMKSVDWRSNKYVYRFYLGFDKADPIYDTGDAWNEIRDIFFNRAKYRLEEALLEASQVDLVLKEQLQIKIMHFGHLEGAPTQVVSQLMIAGYVDKFDYFYQVNDDTLIETANWATSMVGALAGNPSIPNFGVTGPLDTNNDKIFTHSFVHRTHIDVFGYLFPASFKNWWSDDWISTVYGSEHTFRLPNVQIKHNVIAQKINGATQRYEVDHGAQLRLDSELRRGFTQIDAWLSKNNYPRLPLPEVCGYLPATRFLYKLMKHENYNDHHKQIVDEL